MQAMEIFPSAAFLGFFCFLCQQQETRISFIGARRRRPKHRQGKGHSANIFIASIRFTKLSFLRVFLGNAAQFLRGCEWKRRAIHVYDGAGCFNWVLRVWENPKSGVGCDLRAQVWPFKFEWNSRKYTGDINILARSPHFLPQNLLSEAEHASVFVFL